MSIHDTSYTRPGSAFKRVNSAASEPIGPVPPHLLNEDKLQIMRHELKIQHFQDCALACHFYRGYSRPLTLPTPTPTCSTAQPRDQ